AAKIGIDAVLHLMSILSLSLALLNILPFPALDGGRLLFIIIEAVMGRPVHPSWERNAHQIGMLLLLLFIALVTLNDISRIARG
ncbi:MAG: site-2 protease family protein, partial [Patescibacteria group bacterium]|nr:site-2 protease family protein [Patescibacteria group bacterium]